MREFLCTATGVVGLVLSILGTVFTTTGLVLAALVRPHVIGVVFLCVGVGVLAVGSVLVMCRRAVLRWRARLQEQGLEARGTVTEVVQNPFVRVNGRHPWVVRYRYDVQGRTCHGSEAMMEPDPEYRAGATVVVMVDPARVERSVLKRGPCPARSGR